MTTIHPNRSTACSDCSSYESSLQPSPIKTTYNISCLPSHLPPNSRRGYPPLNHFPPNILLHPPLHLPLPSSRRNNNLTTTFPVLYALTTFPFIIIIRNLLARQSVSLSSCLTEPSKTSQTRKESELVRK